jgi:hypothetical protein
MGFGLGQIVATPGALQATRVAIAGLVDEDGTFLGAETTVVGYLEDQRGDVVEGGDGIEFDYQQGSEGGFVGYVPAAAVMKKGKRYTLRIVAVRDGMMLTAVIDREAAYVTA